LPAGQPDQSGVGGVRQVIRAEQAVTAKNLSNNGKESPSFQTAQAVTAINGSHPGHRLHNAATCFQITSAAFSRRGRMGSNFGGDSIYIVKRTG
jgi:hypothetical protein